MYLEQLLLGGSLFRYFLGCLPPATLHPAMEYNIELLTNMKQIWAQPWLIALLRAVCAPGVLSAFCALCKHWTLYVRNTRRMCATHNACAQRTTHVRNAQSMCATHNARAQRTKHVRNAQRTCATHTAHVLGNIYCSSSTCGARRIGYYLCIVLQSFL